MINGKPADVKLTPGQYAAITRNWKTGDQLELQLPMPVKMMEANPLVEETRNQIAVKRGPVVYCLESVDLPKGKKITDIALSPKANLKPQFIKIANSDIMSLNGIADLRNENNWSDKLYKEVSLANAGTKLNIRLIPYYAWDNRGHTNMETWIPFDR